MSQAPAQYSCADCGTPLPPGALACANCGRLVYTDRLKQIAETATQLEPIDPGGAAYQWREALVLLPIDSQQHRTIAQIFIPYLGAVIMLREQPKDAKMEAVIGIAGPIAGFVSAIALYVAYRVTHDDTVLRATEFSAFINLFNLIPFRPLDGGRVAIAVHPMVWRACGVAMAVGIFAASRAGHEVGSL